MRAMLAVTIMVAMPAGAAGAAENAQVAIEAAMTASAAGWSSGDMRRFLAIYAEDAVFVTRDGLVQGRQAIAARYDKSYGTDAGARGKLSFRTLGHRRLSAVHQILFARWTLAYADPAKAAATGTTTLVFERRPDGWKIISDHSS